MGLNPSEAPKSIRFSTAIRCPDASRSSRQVASNSPFGSVTNTDPASRTRFGITKNRLLPVPEPPMHKMLRLR